MKKIYIFLTLIFAVSTAHSQCFPDRHSTNWFDGWISCEASPNPNTIHGSSHWILYDYGEVFELGTSHIWNSNDPSNLGNGLRNVQIDVSLDGENWIDAGTFLFEQANGSNTYEGSEGPDLTGLQARFILITAIDNWGGSCYGFSELSIDAQRLLVSNKEIAKQPCLQLTVSPNPFMEQAILTWSGECTEEVSYEIADALGRVVARGVIDTRLQDSYKVGNLINTPGSYFIKIGYGGEMISIPVTKIK